MGSGAGFLDHDQDGDFDLYLLNGASLPGRRSLPFLPATGFSATTDSGRSPTPPRPRRSATRGTAWGWPWGISRTTGTPISSWATTGRISSSGTAATASSKTSPPRRGSTFPNGRPRPPSSISISTATSIYTSPDTSISPPALSPPAGGGVSRSTADRRPTAESATGCSATTAPGNSPTSPGNWGSPTAPARVSGSSPEISKGTGTPISTSPTTAPPTSSTSITWEKRESPASPRRRSTTASLSGTTRWPRPGWEPTWGTTTETSTSTSR